MKKIIKCVVLLILFASSILACQSEENDIAKPNPENLSRTSELTALLERITIQEVINDNSIDSTACFKLQLPVNVMVNDQFVAITTVADYALVTAIFDTTNPEYDNIVFSFPITVIAINGTETVLQNQSEFDVLKATCVLPNPSESTLECLSFNYPITAFGYNTSFFIANTYTLTNNTDFFAMLFNLTSEEFYAINYPISVNFTHSGIVQVKTINNNSELIAQIQEAIASCGNPDLNACTNPNVLTKDLIIYMPFANEIRDLISQTAATSNFTPTYGTDRNGTANSAVYFPNSENNQHLKLIGNQNNKLIQSDSLSVSVWFKLKENTSLLPKQFFSKANVATQAVFIIGAEENNVPFFRQNILNLYDTNWSNNTNFWTDFSNWHHLVVTIDGFTNTIKLYRDGILQNTLENSNSNIGESILDYYLGDNFKGYLDDLRVYKKTLKQEQVTILYNLAGDSNTCL